MSSYIGEVHEPPAAGRRQSRVTIDVGGTNFVAAAHTLASNSAYFASLFSANWVESANEGRCLFLDQDPAPFGVLLGYMRRGLIRVDDIDTDVLALAEFLGVEKLLLAVKVRWYGNIGKGPVHDRDEETAAAFDREHGGILKAVSAGLFPFFRRRNDVDPDVDYAMMRVHYRSQLRDEIFNPVSVTVHDVRSGAAVECRSMMIGALNGLYADGYELHGGSEINHNSASSGQDCVAFRRRSHSVRRRGAAGEDSATDIFIPSDEEVARVRDEGYTKQFVMRFENSGLNHLGVVAPAEFLDEGDDPNPDPYAQTTITNEVGSETQFWLERHGFVTREEDLKEHSWLIKSYIEHFETIKCTLYSRKVPVRRRGGGGASVVGN